MAIVYLLTCCTFYSHKYIYSCKHQQQMEKQKVKVQITKAQVSSILADDISALSSDLNYFLVYPYCFNKKRQLIPPNTQPEILAYKSDNITINELVIRYKKISNCSVPLDKLSLTFQRGYELDRSEGFTVAKLKKQLRNDDLNGVSLFIRDKKDPQDEINDLMDECSPVLFVGGEEEIFVKDSCVEIEFILDQNQESFYYSIPISKLFDEVKKCVSIEIFRIYAMKIDVNDFEIKYLEKQEWIVPHDTHYSLGDLIDQKKTIMHVVITNPNIKIPKRIRNLENKIIFRGKHLKKQYIQHYDDLRTKKVSSILKEFGMGKTQQYIIKFCETILNPDDTFLKIDKYFDNSKAGNEQKVFVAKVINESAIFYKQIEIIKTQKKFDLDKIDIDEAELNKKHRYQCEKQIETRARNALHEEFKNQNNVSPILYYTSQLKIKEKDGKSSVQLFKGVNAFLRNQKFSKVQKNSEEYFDWMNVYASQLVDQLKKIDEIQMTVYRGVSYESCENVGEILEYKQFMSTSEDKGQAEKFANRAIYIIKTKTGRSIKDYSLFPTQKQVLLLPYSRFRVTKVNQAFLNSRTMNNIKAVYLEEIESERMPTAIDTNFLVWVDDKPLEAKEIFNQINKPLETTILIQLISTDQLKNWLTESFNILKGRANVIMISNMTRVENEITNPIAGVDAVKVMRGFQNDAEIFLYVGYIAKAEEKLASNGVSKEKIEIGNQAFQIMDYIIKKCGTTLNPEEANEAYLIKAQSEVPKVSSKSIPPKQVKGKSVSHVQKSNKQCEIM